MLNSLFEGCTYIHFMQEGLTLDPMHSLRTRVATVVSGFFDVAMMSSALFVVCLP